MNGIIGAFLDGLQKRKPCMLRERSARDEKKLLNKLSEKQIDKIVEDSFPASDPLSH
jgi:hypothetical protein